eukprot:gene9234-10208_t
MDEEFQHEEEIVMSEDTIAIITEEVSMSNVDDDKNGGETAHATKKKSKKKKKKGKQEKANEIEVETTAFDENESKDASKSFKGKKKQLLKKADLNYEVMSRSLGKDTMEDAKSPSNEYECQEDAVVENQQFEAVDIVLELESSTSEEVVTSKKKKKKKKKSHGEDMNDESVDMTSDLAEQDSIAEHGKKKKKKRKKAEDDEKQPDEIEDDVSKKKMKIDLLQGALQLAAMESELNEPLNEPSIENADVELGSEIQGNEDEKAEGDNQNGHPCNLLENPEIMSKLELDKPKEDKDGLDFAEENQPFEEVIIDQSGQNAELIAEALKSAKMLSELQNVKLENIKTYIITPNLPRPPAPDQTKAAAQLHTWVLSESDKKNLKRRGVHIAYGNWTKKECDKLKENVQNFCTVAQVDEQGFRKMLFDDSVLAKRTRTEICFYNKLAEGISRPLREVYRKLRQVYDPDNYKGKFSAAEKKMLISLYKKYGKEWSKIGEEMGRSGASVMRKFKKLSMVPVKKEKPASSGELAGDGSANVSVGETAGTSGEVEGDDKAVAAIVKDEGAEVVGDGGESNDSEYEYKNMIKHGRWTKEETDKLKVAVLKLCGNVETNEIDERVMHWEQIANMVETRNSEQCRRKWQLQLKWKDPAEKTKRWTHEDNARFVMELSRCDKEEERLVEWDKISEALNKYASVEFMKKKWYGFKVMVPDYHSLTFMEIVQWLVEEYVSKLKARFPTMKLD